MIVPATMLALAASPPLFTARERNSLPCGWHMSNTHRLRSDYASRARIVDGVLSVEFAGADGRRTVFLIVDSGAEQRITGTGPITVQQRVAKHQRHKVIFGDSIRDFVDYGFVVCFKS
jgi:hypothetical protein